MKGEQAPCDSIFQQTALNLSTKIAFLETEGEVALGRTAVADLSERAQMAALNLKTCCTVLERGRIDPEGFLECKANARAYEDRLTHLTGLVETALANRSTTLHPRLDGYRADKARIGDRSNMTAGGDTSYTVETPADAVFYVGVRDYYSRAGGDYTLIITQD